jgi:hypothetical protein
MSLAEVEPWVCPHISSFKLMLLQFSSVNKLKEEFDVQISVPNESSHSDQIRLEGKKENVEKVREAIADIVTKQEKKTQEEDEKRKKAATEAATADGSGKASNGPVPAEEPHVNAQMEVDPRFHRHFIVRGAEVLREIQAQCGHCQISFPKQETGDKIVSIRGPKSGVEAAKKRILQVVADLVGEKNKHLLLINNPFSVSQSGVPNANPSGS